MWAIKYTKKRQRVRHFYRNPIYYNPARVLEFWRLKIKKYPQEYSGRDGGPSMEHGLDRLAQPWSHTGPLFSIQFRLPKPRFIGRFHFSIRNMRCQNLRKSFKAMLSKNDETGCYPVWNSVTSTERPDKSS